MNVDPNVFYAYLGTRWFIHTRGLYIYASESVLLRDHIDDDALWRTELSDNTTSFKLRYLSCYVNVRVSCTLRKLEFIARSLPLPPLLLLVPRLCQAPRNPERRQSRSHPWRGGLSSPLPCRRLHARAHTNAFTHSGVFKSYVGFQSRPQGQTDEDGAPKVKSTGCMLPSIIRTVIEAVGRHKKWPLWVLRRDCPKVPFNAVGLCGEALETNHTNQ